MLVVMMIMMTTALLNWEQALNVQHEIMSRIETKKGPIIVMLMFGYLSKKGYLSRDAIFSEWIM